MKINAVLLADRADSLIDILLTAAERNSALTSVEDDLSRLFVVIDKRLMFLSAEEFDAGLLSGSKLQSDRKLRACSAHSLYGEFAVRDRDRSGSDLIASVILNLTDRPLDKLSILDTQFARKNVGAGPTLFPRREVAVPHFLPGGHDHAAVRHAEGLRRVEVESMIQLTDLVHSEPAVVKIQLAHHIDAGVYVLVCVAHLRKILRTCQDHIHAIQFHVIRTLVDAVQAEILVLHRDLSLGILLQKVSHIFPVKKVFAAGKDQVSESVLLDHIISLERACRGRAQIRVTHAGDECRVPDVQTRQSGRDDDLSLAVLDRFGHSL